MKRVGIVRGVGDGEEAGALTHVGRQLVEEASLARVRDVVIELGRQMQDARGRSQTRKPGIHVQNAVLRQSREPTRQLRPFSHDPVKSGKEEKYKSNFFHFLFF